MALILGLGVRRAARHARHARKIDMDVEPGNVEEKEATEMHCQGVQV
jgi:hypothetical protein